jgi:acetyl-CoA synthetase
MHPLAAQELVALGAQPPRAQALAAQAGVLCSLPPMQRWQRLCRELVWQDPFAVKSRLYRWAYADWDAALGPAPAWIPTEDEARSTNIASLMREVGAHTVEELHAWSVADRARFWHAMVQRLGIRFRQPWQSVLDVTQGPSRPQWFVGARMNIAESCFQAPAEQPALFWQREGGAVHRSSRAELQEQVRLVAGAVRRAGLHPADAVAVHMPLTPTAVAIYLGLVWAGCVVVSIADSLAPAEVAARLRLGRARAIFTQDQVTRADKHWQLYAKVLQAEPPRAVVIGEEGPPASRLRPGDVSWAEFLGGAHPLEEPHLAAPHEPTNLLFSSGTTGEPKAIPWSHVTPIKCAADGWLYQDVRPGDRLTWPTNLGWMMGPWLIYASLINGGAVCLYDGAPQARGFGEFVAAAGITMLGVIPTLVKTWRADGRMEGLAWPALRCFSSTGECSNPEDMLYLMSLADFKPVIEYCGGTEIGGGYVASTLVQPNAPSTFSTAALGIELVITDERGLPAQRGEVFLRGPSIGFSTELVGRDHDEVYYAGTPLDDAGSPLRRHGDELERLPNGFFRAQGRADDCMNLGGVKVSAAEIERVLNAQADVVETAAVAVNPPDGGPSRLVIFVVPRAGIQHEASAWKERLQQAIKAELNPLFKIHDVVPLDALPRTASNKVMRRLLRAHYCERSHAPAETHSHPD